MARKGYAPVTAPTATTMPVTTSKSFAHQASAQRYLRTNRPPNARFFCPELGAIVSTESSVIGIVKEYALLIGQVPSICE